MKTLCFMILMIDLCCSKIIVKNLANNVTVARMSDADAKFGAVFEDGAMAYLIESNPIIACNDTITPPPTHYLIDSEIMFVSLIKRGHCSFAHKVKAAQNSGYQGAIVYNNIDNTYFSMPKDDDPADQSIYIPSRMVGKRNGLRLRKYNYTNGHPRFVLIFRPDFDISPQFYIMAFLAFVSLGFMIIGAGFAIKLCRDYCKRRANRLKKSHLKQIPVKRFVKGVDSFDMCAICLEDFVDGDKLRILSCNHAYHMKCIDPWLLKQKRNCPVCKSRVKIPGRIEESDDNISIVIANNNAQTGTNENTPLIHPPDGVSSQFDFGSAANTDVNFMAAHSKINVPHCYDNPCMECTEQDESTVKEPIVSISSAMSINSDAADNQCHPCIQSSTTDNTAPSTSPQHAHHPSDDNLTKLV